MTANDSAPSPPPAMLNPELAVQPRMADVVTNAVKKPTTKPTQLRKMRVRAVGFGGAGSRGGVVVLILLPLLGPATRPASLPPAAGTRKGRVCPPFPVGSGTMRPIGPAG